MALAWGCDLERWYTLDIHARAAMIATHLAKQMQESAEMDIQLREAKTK